MHPVVIAVVLAGIVAFATAVGLSYRHLQGRARLGDGSEVVQIEGLRLGEQATLLQFSTAFCAPCVSTARVLDAVADAHEGTAHVVIDVTDRPELATRFNLLQTPTTLVLIPAATCMPGSAARCDKARSSERSGWRWSATDERRATEDRPSRPALRRRGHGPAAPGRAGPRVGGGHRLDLPRTPGSARIPAVRRHHPGLRLGGVRGRGPASVRVAVPAGWCGLGCLLRPTSKTRLRPPSPKGWASPSRRSARRSSSPEYRSGLVVAGAAAFGAALLNSVFGYCLGCQLYLLLLRAGVTGRGRPTVSS